jgi:hypothetical protein
MSLATQWNRESTRAGLFDAYGFLDGGGQERDMDVGLVIHEVKDLDGHVDETLREITLVAARELAKDKCLVRLNARLARVEDDIVSQVNLYPFQ